MTPLERLEAFTRGLIDSLTDPCDNSWLRPAEAALVEAEAESEVHEPGQNEQCSMTWHGWAVPAILEVLAEHWAPDFEDSIPGCGCAESTTRLDTEIDAAWRDHVAPLIADRIACDPKRAIEALSRKVAP